MRPRPAAVVLLLLVVLCLGGGRAAASSDFDYPAVFNFGDSNSDTGGFWAAFPAQQAPFGMTYFNRPSGRASDGRLVIDFIAMGLLLLSPYLQSIGSNYRHGAKAPNSRRHTENVAVRHRDQPLLPRHPAQLDERVQEQGAQLQWQQWYATHNVVCYVYISLFSLQQPSNGADFIKFLDRILKNMPSVVARKGWGSKRYPQVQIVCICRLEMGQGHCTTVMLLFLAATIVYTFITIERESREFSTSVNY